VFDALSDKLQATLGDVRQRGALTEDDVKATMREIRLALLEADVNFAVVREFTSAVREKALGEEVLKRVDPGQQVVKIVSDELTELMGGAGADLALSPRKPTIVVLAGLQGSGKTTAAAKLARMLREEKGLDVALAACDVYRPAAVEQLVTVGRQAGATVYERGTDMDPVEIAKWARDQAVADGRDVLIVDTSGRLHVDSELMQELASIKKELKPHDVLLVVDAMTGQDAVNVAEQFAEQVGFDGVIMSKLDGDARGGAALSVKAVTGMPILYASTGEKLDAFERFHPDRMAQRILGMGDVLTFVEKAQREVDQDQAAEMERKLRKAEFSFDDFLDQLQTVRRMGPIGNLIGMLPGAGAQLRGMKVDERELDRVEAIVLSMTPEERRRPDLIKGSRRLRIAKGSGTTVQAVNQLVKQFEQMRKLMKSMSRGKMPDIGALMRQAR
jgi:signal recognition particle subunit SRP54